MKALKITMLAIMALAILSCRTVKTVEREAYKADSTAQTNTKTAVEVQRATADSMALTDNSIEEDSAYEVTTTVELSKPDSAGVQYPTRVITKEQTHGRKRQAAVTYRRNGSNQTASNSTEAKQSNTHLKKQGNSDKTISKKPPAWTLAAATLLCLGALALLYLVLKRFRLLK